MCSNQHIHFNDGNLFRVVVVWDVEVGLGMFSHYVYFLPGWTSNNKKQQKNNKKSSCNVAKTKLLRLNTENAFSLYVEDSQVEPVDGHLLLEASARMS